MQKTHDRSLGGEDSPEKGMALFNRALENQPEADCRTKEAPRLLWMCVCVCVCVRGWAGVRVCECASRLRVCMAGWVRQCTRECVTVCVCVREREWEWVLLVIIFLEEKSWKSRAGYRAPRVVVLLQEELTRPSYLRHFSRQVKRNFLWEREGFFRWLCSWVKEISPLHLWNRPEPCDY